MLRRISPNWNVFALTSMSWQPGRKKGMAGGVCDRPKLPKDVTTITLSYTFFEVGGRVPPRPAGPVAPQRGQEGRS